MTTQPSNAAVIVAGGLGLRFGGALPKQYQELGGEAVLKHTIRTFLDHPHIDAVQMVIGEDDTKLFAALSLDHLKLMPPVIGGAARQASVLAGLSALAGKGLTNVLIHDGARPFVTEQIISAVLEPLKNYDKILFFLIFLQYNSNRAQGTAI